MSFLPHIVFGVLESEKMTRRRCLEKDDWRRWLELKMTTVEDDWTELMTDDWS